MKFLETDAIFLQSSPDMEGKQHTDSSPIHMFSFKFLFIHGEVS